eukprot:2033351-Rhodomonas_salina.1
MHAQATLDKVFRIRAATKSEKRFLCNLCSHCAGLADSADGGLRQPCLGPTGVVLDRSESHCLFLEFPAARGLQALFDEWVLVSYVTQKYPDD